MMMTVSSSEPLPLKNRSRTLLLFATWASLGAKLGLQAAGASAGFNWSLQHFKLAHNKRSNLEPICMMQLWFCQSEHCGLFPSLAAKLGLQAGVLPGFNSSLQHFQASSQQRDQTYNPSAWCNHDAYCLPNLNNVAYSLLQQVEQLN